MVEFTKPLTNCPACKKPVRKIISGFSTPHKLKPLSIPDAKKAGFTGQNPSTFF
jgi:predicted nucleic acid-binding Zn ribbon protein